MLTINRKGLSDLHVFSRAVLFYFEHPNRIFWRTLFDTTKWLLRPPGALLSPSVQGAAEHPEQFQHFWDSACIVLLERRLPTASGVGPPSVSPSPRRHARFARRLRWPFLTCSRSAVNSGRIEQHPPLLPSLTLGFCAPPNELEQLGLLQQTCGVGQNPVLPVLGFGQKTLVEADQTSRH